MFLKLKNIGKVSEANIELNGITVVAGENNTGKSTLGKMLFCLFNSFYKINEQIIKERKIAINRVIMRFSHESSNRLVQGSALEELNSNILKNSQDFIENSKLLKNQLIDFYMSNFKNSEKFVNDDSLDNIVNNIIDFLKVSDNEIVETVLRKRFESEFNMQIVNVNASDKNSQVTLKIKEKSIDIVISPNDSIKIEDEINIYTELMYIDDPFVLDDLSDFPLFLVRSDSHRSHLKSKLIGRKTDATVKNAIEQIVTTKKLDNIFKKLTAVCDGDLAKTDSLNIVYKSVAYKEALDISNLSTGLKTFVIIKTLLTNGSLVENGTIVLDEPEIHLHPEWQLLFAEIIVLIQKEFGMHILLNTHSPYFLNAIEVYAAKYEIADKCKYYLAENIEEKSIFSDVSDNIEKIYEKLARPLQDLENERYSHD